MAQLTNIRTVTIPSIGKLPLADDPGTFTPSGEKRDHKSGRLAEDGGYTTSAQAAKLDLNLNNLALDITKLNAVADEDVTVTLSDGHVHMMSQATVQEPAAVANGQVKVTLFANASEQIS